MVKLLIYFEVKERGREEFMCFGFLVFSNDGVKVISRRGGGGTGGSFKEGGCLK